MVSIYKNLIRLLNFDIAVDIIIGNDTGKVTGNVNGIMFDEGRERGCI
jgi:hypothetical protein